jgi:hypothetical protein
MWQYRKHKCLAKESGKGVKIKSLDIEIQRIWNLKFTIIPVVIETIGTVTESLRKTWKRHQQKFDRFTRENSYTWDLTHNTGSTAEGNLKP